MLTPYSAALCRGLIEAAVEMASRIRLTRMGIPRLYAAASLKQDIDIFEDIDRGVYSAALCRGLIEAPARPRQEHRTASYSAALCRGLIEASNDPRTRSSVPLRIPRLYAAASLKP